MQKPTPETTAAARAALRADMEAVLLRHIESGSVNLVDAAVAAMGAAATCLGAMPALARKIAVDSLCSSLGKHADRRAMQINLGEADVGGRA